MKQERSLRRQEELRSAAAAVLLSHGFDAVTHRAVAASAGVPLSSVTYYFADRDDLVRQALEHAGRTWLTSARAAVDALPARLTSRAAVARAVLAVAVGDAEDLGSLYERYVHASRSPRLRDVVADLDRELTTLLGEVLRRSGRSADGARLLLAAVDGLLLGALSAGADDARAQAQPELTRLVGLLPERPR